MANPDGSPIWYELMARDADRAQAFYSAMPGWTVAPFSSDAAPDYRICSAPDGAGVAGLMPLPKDAPFPPVWLIYFGAGDVDAVAERVTSLGGSIRMPPQDIPGVGRFALVADPQGNAFYLMRGDSPDASNAFLPQPGGIGHAVWNELTTPDQAGAFAFYGALFGWEQAGGMPMGEMGDYAFIGHAGTTIGAIMRTPQGAPSGWNVYFHVDDIDAAADTARSGGGTLTQEPMEIPGGDYSAMLTDLDGALVGIVGPRKGATA